MGPTHSVSSALTAMRLSEKGRMSAVCFWNSTAPPNTTHNSQPRRYCPALPTSAAESYKRRFGYNSGKWLIVTTGERRLQNMKRSAELVAEANARLFYFTTMDRVTPGLLLTQPVWQRGGEDVPAALF